MNSYLCRINCFHLTNNLSRRRFVEIGLDRHGNFSNQSIGYRIPVTTYRRDRGRDCRTRAPGQCDCRKEKEVSARLGYENDFLGVIDLFISPPTVSCKLDGTFASYRSAILTFTDLIMRCF